MEEAHNGAEGLRRYEAVPHWPRDHGHADAGMDGRPLILALRGRFSYASILAVSGEPRLLEKARELYVQGRLQKPFDAADLLSGAETAAAGCCLGSTRCEEATRARGGVSGRHSDAEDGPLPVKMPPESLTEAGGIRMQRATWPRFHTARSWWSAGSVRRRCRCGGPKP